MEDVTLWLAFIAGLLSFVSPCVLPLVPAYVGYMGGRATRNVALQTSNKQKFGAEVKPSRMAMILHGIAFVAGFTLVFIAIGLMTTAFVSAVGSYVSTLTTIIGRVGGVIIIVFGLQFMGALRKLFAWFKTQDHLLSSSITSVGVAALASVIILWSFVFSIVALVPLVTLILWMFLSHAFTAPRDFWTTTLNRIEQALYTDTRKDMDGNASDGLSGSFIMGVVFSAGWTPCIGPLLGTILTVTAQTGNVGLAVLMLGAYSLGLGIPFILTAGLLEGAQSILRHLQHYMEQIEFASGVLLIVIGVMVASGQIQSLSQNLSAEQVNFSVRVEECGLGLFGGDLTWSEAGACMGDTLHPIAFNQSAGVELNTETPQMTYVFDVDDAVSADVEIARLDAVAPLTVTLRDADDAVIAESDTLTQIDEHTYVAIAAVQLDANSKYSVVVTSDTDVDFRLKVREAEAITTPDEADDATDTQAADVASVETIDELAERSAPVVGLDVGNRAPDFTVTRINGEAVSLADLRGEVVLLNFWGTWCGPCRREMPEFQNVYEAYQDQGFTILALAVRDNEAAVRAFQDEFGLTFPLALDTGNQINDQYGIRQQPSTLIIDQEGVIVFKNFGIVLESQVSDVISPLLTTADDGNES